MKPSLPLKLFSFSDATGFQEIALPDGKLVKSLLNSDDVFIVSGLKSGKVFVWVGKRASLTEKKDAIPAAVKYLAEVSDLVRFQYDRCNDLLHNYLLSFIILVDPFRTIYLLAHLLSGCQTATRAQSSSPSFSCGRNLKVSASLPRLLQLPLLTVRYASLESTH